MVNSAETASDVIAPIASDLSAVPLHPTLRWRMLRQRFLPLAMFGLCAVGAIWLWGNSLRIVNGWGEVYAPHVELTAPFAARILPAEEKSWKLYDYIRAGEVYARLESLDGSGNILPITAPVDGYVTELGPMAGQVIVPGGSLAGLTPLRGDYILGYLQNTVVIAPTPQSPVIVRTRGAKIVEFTSRIEQVGPLDAGDRNASASDRQRNKNRPLTGLPVRVTIPQNVQLRPGELVDLQLAPEEPATSTAALGIAPSHPLQNSTTLETTESESEIDGGSMY